MSEFTVGRSTSDWWMVIVSVGAFLGAVVVYVCKFHDLKFGSPSAWGSFGDYLGGLLNPIIGLATVVLVVRTLRVTRSEADDTRQELARQTTHLENQIRHFERKERLDEMKKRLDGVLSDWNLALNSPLPTLSHNYLSGVPWPEIKTIKSLLYSPELLGDLKLHAAAIPEIRKDWAPKFKSLVEHLAELEQYCLEYDEESKAGNISDFYRRRVRVPLAALRAVDLIGHDKLLGLNVTYPQWVYG